MKVQEKSRRTVPMEAEAEVQLADGGWSTPCNSSISSRDRDTVPIVTEAWRSPGPVSTGMEQRKTCSTSEVQTPNNPARRESP